MTLRIDDVEACVVERFSDGDILLFLKYRIDGLIDGTLSGAIEVMQDVPLRRSERSQFLATSAEMLQRVVLDSGGKLIGHLCGHEGVGDAFTLKIVVEGYQVEAHLFGDDIHRGTTGQGRIHVHHTGIEAIRGIRCHLVGRLQVIVAVIVMDEGHHIAVNQLTALRHTRRA